MENRYTKVRDKDGYVRDNTTGAIINNDKNAFENYKKRRALLKEKEEKIESLEQRLDRLEKLLDERS